MNPTIENLELIERKYKNLLSCKIIKDFIYPILVKLKFELETYMQTEKKIKNLIH